MISVKSKREMNLKLRATKINELSAYRVLFICACILSLIAGIFAIENSAKMITLERSLAVGEYQDKAEFIKASNDTQCFYGSTNPDEYDFEGQKDDALSCLQYSRDLNSYYLDLGKDNPNIELHYGYSDVMGVMKFCNSEEGKTGVAKAIGIGNLGTVSISCKVSAERGEHITVASVA